MFVSHSRTVSDQICHAAPEDSIAVHATEHGTLGRSDTSTLHPAGGARHRVPPADVPPRRTTADISGSSVVRGVR